jgi:predicted tellurium resistance membrane protein TerC
MNWITNPEIWIALVTLTVLEIVLGIDNIIFISIMAGKLPQNQQARGRQVGLGLAMITRVALLASLAWIVNLTAPFFTIFGLEITGRDLILLGGGLFLISKATREIHDKLEGGEEHTGVKAAAPSFVGTIIQILLLDLVFSLDSVITAVGMAKDLWVMIAAVIIAVLIMLMASGAISNFVNRHPTIKMLALSFLLLIGFTLVAEGFHVEIPKGYIYFAMGFSVLVELLNLRLRTPKSATPVHFHEAYAEAEPAQSQPKATKKKRRSHS